MLPAHAPGCDREEVTIDIDAGAVRTGVRERVFHPDPERGAGRESGSLRTLVLGAIGVPPRLSALLGRREEDAGGATRRARGWLGANGLHEPLPRLLGKWGMAESVEPRVRRLVADHLGVGSQEVVSGTSLGKGPATDALDLLALTLLVEGEFGISLSDRALDAVHSYGELVDTIVTLLRLKLGTAHPAAEPSLRIWTSLRSAARPAAGTLERVGLLTPSTAATIVQDAHRAGRGARLDVGVAAGTMPSEHAGEGLA